MEEKELLHIVVTLFCIFLSFVPAYAVSESGSAMLSIKRSAKEFEARQASETEKYKALIEKANKSHLEHSKSISAREGTLVSQIIQNHQNLDKQTKASKEKGILIFVSFSMPRELLWSYFEQARLYGGRLVTRGLVENSFKKTIQAMQLDKGRQLILDINPRLFKEQEINQVPAIIITDGTKADRFIGSVSIKHALEESGASGDLSHIAQSKLLEVSK